MIAKRRLLVTPSLSRKQFCCLTRLSVQDLKDYRKRNLLPFTPFDRGYSEMQAILTCAMEQLVDFGVRRATAASIAQATKNEVLRRWREISLSVASHHPPMLFGAFIRRHESRFSFVCTTDELGNLYRGFGRGGSVIVGSISSAVAGIELRRMQDQMPEIRA